jgi:membrane protein
VVEVSQTLPSADEAAEADSAGRISGQVAKWRLRGERLAKEYEVRAQAHPILGIPVIFLGRYTARQGVLCASAVAFRLFLWLVPLSLLAAGILSKVANSDGTDLASAAKDAGVTGAASQQVVTALQNGNRSWWIAVLTGAALFLWATRTLMRNLTVVHAHSWDVQVPKPKQKDVLITTASFAVAWIAVFLFTAALHRFNGVLPHGSGILVGIVLQAAAVGGLWYVLSRRLPNHRYDWLDLVPGALIVGFGMAILDTVGRIYLPARLAHSSAIYGSLGIASVMLAWLLLIGQLIVTSALSNSMWSDYRASKRAPASS